MKKASGQVACLLAAVSGGLLSVGVSAQGKLWPFLLIALVPLLTALQESSKKRAISLGVLTGLCHYLFLLYWIVIVLGRYGGFPWFLSLPGLLLLAVYMSIYLVFFALAARLLLIQASPLVLIWGLPCIWVGLDWVRSFLFSGFPWMDIGYALWSMPRLIQIADLVGHYGLTFLVVLINVLFYCLLSRRLHKNQVLQHTLPVVCVLFLVFVYSIMAWKAVEREVAGAQVIKIGVVQGNIDQSKKWVAEEQLKTVNTYLQHTGDVLIDDQVKMVVWPETALPFYPVNSPLMSQVSYFAHKKDTPLLTGAPWYEIVDPVKRDIRFYNRAFLILPDGGYGGRYDKSHLVPYGEYVPLKIFFPFLAPLVEAVGDFTPGVIKGPLQYGNLRSGILICFESIFPAISRKWVQNGANILINLTNDAWYGRSSAPYQSFAMTVFRAVETRRSLVRAANTGVSGFIDPLGRVMRSSEIFVPWAASASLPLMEKRTIGVSYGFLFAPSCFFLGILFLIAVYMQRRLRKA